MKKASLPLILALILSLVLTACGSKNDSPASSANSAQPSESGSSQDTGKTEPVTIQFWQGNYVEEERVAVLKDVIAKFEEQNPGITVEQVPVAEEDFSNRVSAALGANQLPALIEGGIDQVLFLGTEGVTSNKFNEDVINELGKDDFFKGALDTLKNPEGEGYYAIPASGWVQGIWYNKALFKEKGLEPPTTWENILKAAKAFYDPKKQKYGIVVGTTKDDFSEQTFSQFALSNGAQIFDKEGKVNFNTPEMTEAVKFYKDLAQFTPPGAESWREAKEMYLNGSAPMVMYSTYIMGDLSQNKELAGNTGFALPEHKVKASFGQITAYAVTNTVSEAEQEAAKKFAAFLMQKENYIQLLHLSPGGSNPTRKSIAQDPGYLDNDVLKSYGDVAAQIPTGLEDLQRFGFQEGRINPKMGNISSQFIIGEAINEITEKGKDIEKTMKSAQEKMEKSIK